MQYGGQQRLPFFCVLYTSGSTGRPLGVKSTEQGFLNRYTWMQGGQSSVNSTPAALAASNPQHPKLTQQRPAQAEQCPVPILAAAPPELQHVQQPHMQPAAAGSGLVPLQPGHVVVFKTAVGFVDHLWELLAPFLSGADMLIVPEDTAAQPVSVPEVAAAAARADAPAAAHTNASAGTGANAPAAGGNIVLLPDWLMRLLVAAHATHLVSAVWRLGVCVGHSEACHGASTPVHKLFA
jgi:hypothetical protein